MPIKRNDKQSVYLPEEDVDAIWAEARRLDRSFSWIVQQAWKMAKGKIREMPSLEDVMPARAKRAG